MAKINVEKRREWADVLDRLEASGLTVASFCQKEGIDQQNIYVWRKKLGRMPPNGPKPAKTRTIEMTFPCGITLVIKEGCDPGVLQRVLSALNGEDR